MRRRLALLAAGLALTASPGQAAPDAHKLLPSVVDYQPQDVVERGLWLEMDEQEAEMRNSRFLITDPVLNAYVRKVLCRAVGKERCGSTRIYLLRTPHFNAMMAPNGMMIVWSGLLLRARNEAELASVLGHEFVHFEKQHSLKSFRDMKAKTDAMTWLGFIPGGFFAQIGLMGSVFRFNREMERQADMQALEYLAASGYDPMASSQIWEQLRGEMEASAKAKKGATPTEQEGGFFASHPNSKDRMEYLRAAALRKPASSDNGAADYHNAITPWWPQLIDDQIKLNDFATTEFLLENLARGEWSADLLYARGELHRARAKKGDFEAALGFYRQSVDQDPTLAEGWRGLGLTQLRLGKKSEGQNALRRYIELMPNAADRKMIEMMAGGGK